MVLCVSFIISDMPVIDPNLESAMTSLLFYVPMLSGIVLCGVKKSSSLECKVAIDPLLVSNFFSMEDGRSSAETVIYKDLRQVIYPLIICNIAIKFDINSD